MLPSLRHELAPTLRLAVPVVIAELGWMGMGVVDTIMVGPLGPAAISAVGVGASIHLALSIFGMGVLLGLDTLVSQAYGARDVVECHRWLFHGVVFALSLALPSLAICLVMLAAMPVMGFHPQVLPLLRGYFAILLWSTPLLLVYAACRRYLQGMHVVTPIMFALVSANLINGVGNWALIHGHLGLPRLGVNGSAWATCLSRLYMLLVLVAAIWWYDRGRGTNLAGVSRAIERRRLVRLWRLGSPAASQVAAEVGVFSVATVLAGTLDPVSSASHQIALNIASVAFMVPLGIASAGAVRVGQAVGARESGRVAAAGWTAILLGTLFMMAAGLLFVAIPRRLIGLFTHDPSVLALGASLLTVAAVFQLFDGIQGVTTGTLRGLGDTRTPMVVNLAAHWMLGLPVGFALCFWARWGVFGLWIGLSIGLIVTGGILLWVWIYRVRHLKT